MEEYLGTWKLAGFEGDESALAAAMGIPDALAKKIVKNNATSETVSQSFSKKGDAYMFSVSQEKTKMESYKFKFGEPTTVENLAESEIQVTYSFPGELLIETRETDAGTVTIEYRVDNYKMFKKIIYGEKELTSVWMKCLTK